MTGRKDKLLFIDTETGGLDPSVNSLLSMALVIWQDFKIVDSMEVYINDGKLEVTESAMRINRINIEYHKRIALTPRDALKEMDFFLTRHFSTNEKITLAGHNVSFDVNFLKYFLLKCNYDFAARFTHRFVDTSSILYYLYLSGVIDQKAISSQEAFDLFGIDSDGRHTALGDAVATAKLFSILLRVIDKKTRMPTRGDTSQASIFGKD